MKENRQLSYDINDIKIIQKKTNKESWSFLLFSNMLFLFKAKIVAFLIPLSKKLKFYNIAKWIYKPSELRHHANMPIVFSSEDSEFQSSHIAKYLATLKEKGVISRKEYDKKKKELLKRI